MGDSRPLDRDLRALIRWDLNLILCIHCGSGGQDLFGREIGGAGRRKQGSAAKPHRRLAGVHVSGAPGAKTTRVWI